MYRDNNGESILVVIRDRVFFEKSNCFSYIDRGKRLLSRDPYSTIFNSIDRFFYTIEEKLIHMKFRVEGIADEIQFE